MPILGRIAVHLIPTSSFLDFPLNIFILFLLFFLFPLGLGRFMMHVIPLSSSMLYNMCHLSPLFVQAFQKNELGSDSLASQELEGLRCI